MARTGVFDKDCIYSVVKNTSGATRKFGFLPPHGVELAANEEYTVFGNILEALVRGDRGSERRHHQAFAKALDREDLTIVRTPAPILKDATTGATKALRLNNGTLGTVDPCWTATSDSLEEVPA